MTLPRAVLLDLDGTLIDTEELYLEVAGELLGAHGLALSEEARIAAIGSSMETLAELVRAAGLEVPAEVVIEDIVAGVVARLGESVPWRDGARDLLAALAGAGIRVGLVTMSYRVVVDRVLRDVGSGFFAVVVSGDDVAEGKPAPEAYVRAAGVLGLDPGDCVAVEDSQTGAAAARRAGMWVIGAPFYRPLPADTVDEVWDSLVGRRAEDLLNRPLRDMSARMGSAP
ncbi:HAD family phosphatase [Amycolatopsis sp. AA4]|uniref:HAD family hydrolase n=1 Tax=Actinomycetes TaxID=1760 RepID=UPI0001B545B9|nr:MULTISPECIES: HAD family phosphatase [Actinomycetes]ATY13011.1 HAD family phosphatase [Amycolatopsis sp. AA4]EFL08882.1 phosphoglycolate phosphatase [Streptomyces sp. AA4]